MLNTIKREYVRIKCFAFLGHQEWEYIDVIKSFCLLSYNLIFFMVCQMS